MYCLEGHLGGFSRIDRAIYGTGMAQKTLAPPTRAAAVEPGEQPSWARRLAHRLFEPVDGASLAVFRMLFGAIMIWEVWRYFSNGWIERYSIEPSFHFTYYGFGWVQPWPGNGMYWHDAEADLTEVEMSPFATADFIEPLRAPAALRDRRETTRAAEV